MHLSILAKIFLYLLVIITFSSSKAADGMPQFNAETFPSQLFWLIISFSALYCVVSLILLPRIRENIRLRSNKISNDLERAETIKKEIERMKQEYELKISDAKNKAQNIIKKAINKANSEYTNNLEIIKKQLEKKYEDTEKRINLYKENIEKEISSSASLLTSTIIGKILNKEVSIEEIEASLKQNKKGI